MLPAAPGVFPYFQQQQQLRPPRMPKVVPNQRKVFETSEELLKYQDPNNEIKFAGSKDELIKGCQKGELVLAFTRNGTNLPVACGQKHGGECNFDKEPGKVHIRSHLIFNGVCVVWSGWLDLASLTGRGCLSFDEAHAAEQDALMGQTKMDVG